MSESSRPFHILSLSGGGFRGLFTARLLAKLEREAGKPIGQCFDLICGTSIGGILALAIGLEKPMREIADIMERKGEEIFPTGWIRRFVPNCLRPKIDPFRGFFTAMHKGDELKKLIDCILESSTMSDSHHRLMIPTINYSAGEPQFFKTSHHENFKYDTHRKMSDIAMATSAAPTFLPIYRFEKTGARYVDGGLVGNNPGLFGIHEAEKFLGQSRDSIYLLSIGTMGSECRADVSQSDNIGIWGWGANLFLLTISVQEKIANYIMRHQLDDRYYCIDENPTSAQEKNIGLDVADKNAIDTLNSMADRAAQKFIGLPKCSQFLNHTPAKFEPIH